MNIDFSREERAAVIALTALLLLGSVLMHGKETRVVPIAIERNGIARELSLQDAARLLAEEAKVNINTAGIDELTLVPGIGQKTAERIIECRRNSGGFASANGLTEVKGIGAAKLKKIMPFIKVE